MAKPNRQPAPTGFRPTPQLRAALDKAANTSGRSLSQEIVSRLERTFWEDDADERAAKPAKRRTDNKRGLTKPTNRRSRMESIHINPDDGFIGPRLEDDFDRHEYLHGSRAVHHPNRTEACMQVWGDRFLREYVRLEAGPSFARLTEEDRETT